MFGPSLLVMVSNILRGWHLGRLSPRNYEIKVAKSYPATICMVRNKTTNPTTR